MNTKLDLIQIYGFLPILEYNSRIDFRTLAQTLKKEGAPFAGIYATVQEYQEVEAIFAQYECSILHISEDVQSAFLQRKVSILKLPTFSDTSDYYVKVATEIQNYINELLGLQLIHIGVNSTTDAQSQAVTKQFRDLLHLPVRETPDSYFVGSLIEVMRKPFLGECGHIAIGTKNIALAYHYYKELGYEFNEETIIIDENKKLILIYFKDEIGNFAIHLKQL